MEKLLATKENLNHTKKMRLVVLIISLAILFPNKAFSQEDEQAKKFELNGYITNMQSVSVSELPETFPEEYITGVLGTKLNPTL